MNKIQNYVYEQGTRCPTHHLIDDQVKEAFVSAFNHMYANRSWMAEDYGLVLAALTDTAELDRKAEVIIEMPSGNPEAKPRMLF